MMMDDDVAIMYIPTAVIIFPNHSSLRSGELDEGKIKRDDGGGNDDLVVVECVDDGKTYINK